MNLLFIVGLPRSGTTWLLSFFENHSQCHALKPKDLGIELDFATKETGAFERLSSLPNREIIKRFESACKSKRTIYVEKTPSHLFYIPKIRSLFPDSKILLVKRNILDVIYSMAQPTPWWRGGPETLEESVQLAKRFLNAERQYREAYDYIIEYEDLWEDPIKAISPILKGLKLKEDEAEGIFNKIEGGKTLSKSLKGASTGEPGKGQLFSGEELERIFMK